MEDLKLKQKGESPDERMRRICLPLMNCLSPDLNFTAEISSEFKNGKFTDS